MKNFLKKIWNKLKSLDKGTVVRTIMQVLVYANELVALIGQTSFASALWYQIVSFVLAVLVTAVTFWYNNDFSSAAILVRDLFDMVKDGKITADEVKSFMEKYKKNKGE